MNGLRSNLGQYEFVLLSRSEGPVWRRDDWHRPERCLDNVSNVKLGRRVKRVVQDNSSLIELCVPQPGGQVLETPVFTDTLLPKLIKTRSSQVSASVFGKNACLREEGVLVVAPAVVHKRLALAQVHTGNGLRISKRGKYNGRGKILNQKATAKAGRYNKRPSKSP